MDKIYMKGTSVGKTHRHKYGYATEAVKSNLVCLDWKYCFYCGKIKPQDVKKYIKYVKDQFRKLKSNGKLTRLPAGGQSGEPKANES